MPIPDFQTIMLPLLQIASDGKEYNIHDFLAKLTTHFAVTKEELEVLIPSGRQSLFYNRVGWARTYLSKAGLLEQTKRSYYVISDRGRSVLKTNPGRIDIRFLDQFSEFKEFHTRHTPRTKNHNTQIDTTSLERKTPEEQLEEAYQEIRDSLAQDLLTLVKQSSPSFFEHLVVELLVNMGYGGSRLDAARAVGQAGDEGIDGIIDEDRLGLDMIYIQAKRWENVVGRPEIQKFVGALAGKRARKGIFITTSSFTKEAIDFTSSIEPKIVLIDGKRLTEFMMDFNVGVTNVISYQIKRVDSDYFENI